MAFDPVSYAMGAKSGGGGGSGGGVLVCNVDMQTMALDKTWQEIVDAGFAVVHVSSEDGTSVMPLIRYGNTEESYAVQFINFESNTQVTFIATSAAGYPVAQMG